MIITSEGRPRILFLAHAVPSPDDAAGNRSFHLLRALASTYDVALLAVTPHGAGARIPESVRALCAGGVQAVPHPAPHKTILTSAASVLAKHQPLTITQGRVPAMQQVVTERLQRQKFQAVHLDHLMMAQYVFPKRTGTPFVLDVGVAENEGTSENATAPPWMRLYASRQSAQCRQHEIDVCRQIDHILVPTEGKRADLETHGLGTPGTVTVLGDGVDSDRLQPVNRDPASQTLLFAGSLSTPATVEGLLWFYDSLWPLIKKQVPGGRLNLVGSKPGVKIRGLAQADDSITVTETNGTFLPHAAHCAAFILPLLTGHGSRDSALHALALALPTVSTRIGVAGIAGTGSGAVLLGNSAEEFASACVKLLRDPRFGTMLGAAGRHLIETRYSWAASSRDLLAVYAKLLMARDRMSRV